MQFNPSFVFKATEKTQRYIEFHPFIPWLAASCGDDGLVFFWDIRSSEQLGGFKVRAQIIDLQWHPGGSSLSFCLPNKIFCKDVRFMIHQHYPQYSSLIWTLFTKDSELYHSTCLLSSHQWHPLGYHLAIGLKNFTSSKYMATVYLKDEKSYAFPQKNILLKNGKDKQSGSVTNSFSTPLFSMKPKDTTVPSLNRSSTASPLFHHPRTSPTCFPPRPRNQLQTQVSDESEPQSSFNLSNSFFSKVDTLYEPFSPTVHYFIFIQINQPNRIICEINTLSTFHCCGAFSPNGLYFASTINQDSKTQISIFDMYYLYAQAQLAENQPKTIVKYPFRPLYFYSIPFSNVIVSHIEWSHDSNKLAIPFCSTFGMFHFTANENKTWPFCPPNSSSSGPLMQIVSFLDFAEISLLQDENGVICPLYDSKTRLSNPLVSLVSESTTFPQKPFKQNTVPTNTYFGFKDSVNQFQWTPTGFAFCTKLGYFLVADKYANKGLYM